MLDLDQTAVINWLSDVHPTAPGWPPPVRAIETAADAPCLLAQLGAALDELGREHPSRLTASLSNPDIVLELQRAFAQLGAARLLRILSWLAESGIASTGTLAARFTEGASAEARALRAALAAIGRQALRERVFAPDRLAALAAASAHALKPEEQN